MSRFYTRAEQRAYREKRRAQAKLVAYRLMGKKSSIPDPWDDRMDALNYRYKINFYAPNPRSSIYITGLTS